jgi:hypothetical protein
MQVVYEVGRVAKRGEISYSGNEAKIGMESWAAVESLEMAVKWWVCEVLQIPVSFEQ